MADVSVTLLGGFAAAVDGVPVPERGLAPEEGARAREAARTRPRPPAAPRAGDGRALARPRPRRRRRTTSTRRCTSRGARSAPDAIELRDEVLSLAADVDVDRLELAAARGAPLGHAGGLPGGALALRRRAAAGEPLRRLGGDAARGARDAGGASSSDGARRARLRGAARSALPADASSFVGRGRELAELTVAAPAHAPADPRRRRAAPARRGSRSSSPAAPRRRTRTGAALVELARARGPAPRAGRRRRRARRARAARAGARRRGDRLPRAAHAAARARQLRAPARRDAALADTLLRAAPRLTIVATSREPLRVPGEVVFRVPVARHPGPRAAAPARTSCSRYEAVSLFVERAAAAAPGFALDEENAEDVARICLRLDGLPLALELAAGRLGALSPAAIAERLDDRFRLLRTGSRAAPTRQQTLTATLQWSHDLLEPDERMLLPPAGDLRRRLRARGGRERLRGRRASTRAEVADVLARLVEKSLVAVEGGGRERRYRLLETVRIYARERLDEAGEAAALAERHARWALALAERQQRLAAARPRRGEPARGARHAARARAARRAPPLRRAAGRSGCGGSTSTRRSGASPRRSPPPPERHDAPRRGAARRGGDRLPQRRARPTASRSPRRATPSPRRSATARARVAGAAVPRRVRRRERRRRGRDAVARARARARAPRGLRRPRRRSASTRSASPTGSSATWRAPTSSSPESIERFRALEGSPERDPAPRSTSPRSGRASPRAVPGSGSSSRTRCSRSSRSRATRRSATRSRTRRASRAPAATSSARARCSTRALRASSAPATTPAARPSSSGARTSRSPRASSRRRARTSRRRSSCGAG